MVIAKKGKFLIIMHMQWHDENRILLLVPGKGLFFFDILTKENMKEANGTHKISIILRNVTYNSVHLVYQ